MVLFFKAMDDLINFSLLLLFIVKINIVDVEKYDNSVLLYYVWFLGNNFKTQLLEYIGQVFLPEKGGPSEAIECL